METFSNPNMEQIDNKREPLVSVVVITYNSAKTVLETLDSIKAQTYQNIELIISDDCSKDNTLEKCSNWLNANCQRFVHSEIISVQENTGTSANVNRGIKKCKGEWIKQIAGDDRLLKSCIQDNVDFINENPNSEIVISKVKFFGNPIMIEKYRKNFRYRNFKLPHRKFYRKLLIGNFIPASTSFINKSVYEKVGYYDESIPLMEDWPFWIKACRGGCSFLFNDVETVEYRVEESVSITNNKSQRYVESEVAAHELSLKYQKEMSLTLWSFTLFKTYLRRILKRLLHRDV